MTTLKGYRRRTAQAVCTGFVAVMAGASSLQAQQTVTLPARDRMLDDAPVEVYAVGRAEGRDWEMLSGVRGMAFDASDNLYVLDGQNHRVLVFDASGAFVRQFGRRGGGPGEFQAPLHIAVGRDGNVVVSDLGNRAFVVYTPAGQHVRNVPYPNEIGLPTSGVHADPRGGLLVRSMSIPQPGATGPSETVIYRQPLTPGTPSVVLRIPAPAPPVVMDAPAGGQGTRFVMRRDPVFAPRITAGVLPDGTIAYQHEEGYAVHIADAAGRPVRTITRDIRPRRVTRQDEDAWRERQREGGTTSVVVTGGTAGTGVAIGSGAPRGIPGTPGGGPLPDPDFAETMAVISSIRTDVQGRIWVQRRDTDGNDRGPIDLIDGAGRYIGTLPAQAMPVAVSATGLAAWNVTDDLGIERVLVRRLPQGWR